MKPNFALSLSFEGIGLLRRVEGGWHLLAEVALDSDDLAGDLAAMRQMAVDLDGPDFRTKLILPNDQIKYLTLDTGRQSEANRRLAAETALEESTPYRAEDLCFDLAKDGRKTHVAAVARETLEEAESFVAEHAFNPVSFVATPDPETGFAREAFLGDTQASTTLLAGATLERDTTPVVIVGSGPLPLPEPEPAPEATDAAEPLDDGALLSLPQEAGDTPPEDEGAARTADPGDRADETPIEAPADPTPGFASIRARKEADAAPAAAPALGAAASSQTGVNAPDLPPAPSASRLTEQTEPRFDPAKLVAGFKIDEDEVEEETGTTGGTVTSFFSRRSKPEATSAPEPETKPESKAKVPETKAETAAASSEKRRMTVFGARETEVAGKPRFLGLILTALLLVGLALVAAWASFFLEDGVSSLFPDEEEIAPQIVEIAPAPLPGDTVPAPAPEDLEIVTIPEGHAEKPPVETVRVSPEAVETLETGTVDAAGNLVDSALVEATEEDMAHPTAPTEQEARARYAVTGIWERAPEPPATLTSGGTDDLYIASIDAPIPGVDALALPDVSGLMLDASLPRQISTPAVGTTYDLDERGLVIATPEGALTPSGTLVYLGRPPVLPDTFPDREALAQSILSEEAARLAELRPRARPTDLVENSERAANGGLSIAELGNKRPKARPFTSKEEQELDQTPTRLAVKESLKPRQRPANIAQLANRAKPADPVVASPVAASVTPSIPSKASVARQATIKNAINLNKVNLIGVYGTASSRRALVRLSSGRYKKVQVGDRIDGGKVSAIGETELRYQKSGKNIVLKLPKG
ncbi:hypothetical protein [Shimia sp. SDUM112013]|uniref:hypothetical protein n=1 Tax=Shimia sp. SDUM112013 TaxID=3136160 RepID=UPI0032EEAC81